MATISYYRGDDKTWTVAFTDSAGDPIDITGYKLWLTVKTSARHSDADAVVQVVQETHSDPTAGVSSFTIGSGDVSDDFPAANDYVYDIQTKDASGNISTVELGTFQLLDGITRATE